jgi:hypothetical protein
MKNILKHEYRIQQESKPTTEDTLKNPSCQKFFQKIERNKINREK